MPSPGRRQLLRLEIDLENIRHSLKNTPPSPEPPSSPSVAMILDIVRSAAQQMRSWAGSRGRKSYEVDFVDRQILRKIFRLLGAQLPLHRKIFSRSRSDPV